MTTNFIAIRWFWKALISIANETKIANTLVMIVGWQTSIDIVTSRTNI